MKDNRVTAFAASGFCVLRTPLLTFEEFLSFSEALTFAEALRSGGDLVASAGADRVLMRRRLMELVKRPEVREALWLASPEFYDSLSIWAKDPESEKGQKLERALYRYIARMTSRPTPFGLFAGCTLGEIGTDTCLQIGSRSQYSRRSRLDMEYLCNLAEKISLDAAYQPQTCFRCNTSLYPAAGRYHHAQSYLAHDVRCYRLVATEPTPYLAATLRRAASGATAAELATALATDDPEISLTEAEDYIRQLVESQVLVSELTPPITGPEPLEDMLAQLERSRGSAVSTVLRSVSQRLRDLDEHGLGNDLVGYQEIVNAVSQLPCEYKLDHLVQVDMMKKAAQVTLDERLIADILHGVEVLRSLDASQPSDPLTQFKQEFRERYQEQEIPLVLALDDEIGIGFERNEGPGGWSEPLLENMDFSSQEEDTGRKVQKWELILLRRLEDTAPEKKSSLELDAALLQDLRAKTPFPLPDAFAAVIQILGPTGASADKLSFHLQSAGGPSGAILLGRFCPVDRQLTAYVREHLRAEEESRADVIYAEVTHLPEGRVGNVLCRPMLRNYEIPFLATSRAPIERQIPITDLMVSVPGERIVLRSQRLGCEVAPRLTSAHAYPHSRNLKLYKFLCLLQTQGICGGLSWNWGILEEASFLPRVTFGNIVFSPARWRIDKKMIEELVREPGPKRLRKMADWQTAHGLPRFALLVEADNQLLIDFENVLSVETLIEYVKNRQSIQLVEMLADPRHLYAHGPEGTFTHELVVPFVHRKAETKVATESQRREFAEVTQASENAVPAEQEIRASERNFLPGSEWLFAKIYASPSQVDRLLLECVKPLAGKVLASGAADSWFFIRYGDPHWHLRLRFHGNPGALSAEVLPCLWESVEPLRQQGKIWRVQLDTYEREVERYGGPMGMRLAEKLFQYDSELVLELLTAIGDQLGTNSRWHLAFAAVDRLLDALGLDWSARQRLVNQLGMAQEKNFSVNQTYKKQLSEKFRQERRTLGNLLESEPAHFPAAVHSALASFTRQIETIHAGLQRAQQMGQLSKSIEELAGSYVHMHLNRLFRFAANAQEMVLYDFLARSYDSRLARGKRTLQSGDRM